MMGLELHRTLEGHIAGLGWATLAEGVPTREGKIKAPPSAGRMWLVGLEIFGIQAIRPAGAFHQIANDFKSPSAVLAIGEGANRHDDAG